MELRNQIEQGKGTFVANIDGIKKIKINQTEWVNEKYVQK